MSKPRDERQNDLFRPAPEEIINLDHPLVRLTGTIDWELLDPRFASVCRAGASQPPLPTRLVAGLFILKHMHDLSDEALCARWLENPYFQFFCGELTFCHELRFDHSSLTRRRQRLGETELVALLQKSLAVNPSDLNRNWERVWVSWAAPPRNQVRPLSQTDCGRFDLGCLLGGGHLYNVSTKSTVAVRSLTV